VNPRAFLIEAIIDHRELLLVTTVALAVALSIDLYTLGSPSVLTFLVLLGFGAIFVIIIRESVLEWTFDGVSLRLNPPKRPR
jgi:hypothetical protein